MERMELYHSDRSIFKSTHFVKILLYCSKLNSSGLFEVKSQPIRLRSNSHSTFLSVLCHGGGDKIRQRTMNELFKCIVFFL